MDLGRPRDRTGRVRGMDVAADPWHLRPRHPAAATRPVRPVGRHPRRVRAGDSATGLPPAAAGAAGGGYPTADAGLPGRRVETDRRPGRWREDGPDARPRPAATPRPSRGDQREDRRPVADPAPPRRPGPDLDPEPVRIGRLGTCRFSPLMFIDTFDDALRAGQWLSDAGHADDGGIKGQEFWDSLARRMLAPALFLAAREHHTLDDVF